MKTPYLLCSLLCASQIHLIETKAEDLKKTISSSFLSTNRTDLISNKVSKLISDSNKFQNSLLSSLNKISGIPKKFSSIQISISGFNSVKLVKSSGSEELDEAVLMSAREALSIGQEWHPSTNFTLRRLNGKFIVSDSVIDVASPHSGTCQ